MIVARLLVGGLGNDMDLGESACWLRHEEVAEADVDGGEDEDLEEDSWYDYDERLYRTEQEIIDVYSLQ